MPRLYRYEELREVHLEVTARCNVACPMCARNVHGGRASPSLPQTELSLGDVQAILPGDLVRRLEVLLLCGNYGDPIVARDTLDILEWARGQSRRLRLVVHTHGSARDPAWWRALARLKVRCVFGIDGLADTLGLYRQGARFERVMASARAFIEAGGKARWQMLAFRHNEHQIEEARALAGAMGFERFTVKHSHRFYRDAFVARGPDGRPDPDRPPRFPVYDAEGRVVSHLEPPGRHELDHPGFARALERAGGGGFRKLRGADAVDCKVAGKGSVYVSAEGLVLPCCWVANLYAATVNPETHPVHRLARATVGGLDGLRVPPNTLESVVEGPFFRAVEASWARPTEAQGRLRTCARVCGGGRPLRAENRR